MVLKGYVGYQPRNSVVHLCTVCFFMPRNALALGPSGETNELYPAKDTESCRPIRTALLSVGPPCPYLNAVALLLFSGYHKCSKEEAARLAALVYRVRFGESKQELQAIPSMVRELVPSDMVKMQSSNDWKRAIVAAYNSDAGKCTVIF